MRLSRLRLRLTAAFAIAFATGLGLLAATVLGYLWHEASTRLDTRLTSVANEVATAFTREIESNGAAPPAVAADEVVREWPHNGDTFAILDGHGAVVAGMQDEGALQAISQAWSRAPATDAVVITHADRDVRAVSIPFSHAVGHGVTASFRIVAFGSTEGIERDIELLGRSLAPAAALIILISLAGGYALARRALHPVSELRAAIAAVAPTDLSHRLPVEPNDEIGALAAEFNGLLGRLDEAQQRNRGFVREAAHQIRTPLTLVLGEAGHELTAPVVDRDRTQGVLGRIRTAAEQMKRRVDELFLLAEAQAGEPVRLDDDVEVDGLVLECTDLMRGRASGLGRTLAIGRAEPVVMRGNAMLLKEALVELIENGCKYGTPGTPVTVSAYADAGGATIAVETAGDAFEMRTGEDTRAPEGLGLPIVRWIARSHGGDLYVERVAGRNVLLMRMGEGKG